MDHSKHSRRSERASRPPLATAPRAAAAKHPPSDGERLLRAADAVAHRIEPGTTRLVEIRTALESAGLKIVDAWLDCAQFYCALQLALAEGRLAHVTDKAGMLPPGPERVRLALEAYLDFTLAHGAVARLCTKARLHHLALAELVQQRNAGVALLISVELSSMGWKRPQECARLLQSALTDCAAVEILEMKPNTRLRGGLTGSIEALAEGFAQHRRA